MSGFHDLRDRIRIYGVYGGTPSYLATIDPKLSFGENVAHAVLSPRGPVRLAVETALHQERSLRKVGDYRALMTAIGRGATTRNEIAQSAGLGNDYAMMSMLDTLRVLGYVTAERSFRAPGNAPYRYRIHDPAFRFHFQVVSRFRAELETNDPHEVWQRLIRDRLDTYLGRVFEDVVRQAWLRLRAPLGLPMVADWSRWEGHDRNRESLEMDIVTRLTGGAMLTGAVKWNASPLSPSRHWAHLRDLERLGTSGRKWAHEALKGESILLYASAGGFEPGFRKAVAATGRPQVLWTLQDLYDRATASPHLSGGG